MESLFDLFDPLTGQRKLKSDHVVDSAQFSSKSVENQLSQNSSSNNKELHYAFLEETNNNSSLQSRINSALKAANIEASPIKLFDAINGFTISVSPTEAKRLEAIPTIRSIEADRPLPLTPPVEVIRETNNSAGDSSFFSESESSPGWKEIDRAVSLDQYYVKTKTSTSKEEEFRTNTVSAAALPTYNNGAASTGEILPYGVKAVWGGSDISTKGNAGSGTYAFVIDSGVLDTTGDLIINRTWSKSWVSGETAFTDGNGHGTHVAGTIAALANGIGVVGVAPGAEVISLKVFDSAGGGASYSTIIDAVNYATQVINDNDLDKSKVVINMSLGGSYSAGMDNAVKNAASQGIRFAIAAGNSGNDADYYSPASAGDHENVFTVSAVDNKYQMPSWSNWDNPSGGDDVDFAAPGVDVYSYYQGGDLAYLSGTSMAAPHVAGLALMGDIKAGEMVQGNAAGYADPFALIDTGEDEDSDSSPEPTPPEDHSYLYLGAASKTDNITISNTNGSIQQKSLEDQLGLENGILDTNLNGTKEAIDATEGSAFQASSQGKAGDIISFKFEFETNDYLPYADYAFYSVNQSVFSLASLSMDTTSEEKKKGLFSYTLGNSDFGADASGEFKFSLGVMDSLDNNYDSTLTITDFEIKEGSNSVTGKTIAGTLDDDVIIGGDLNDELYGDSGKDSLTGGAKNDFIDGGEDSDIAYYTGELEEYNLSYKWNSKELHISDSYADRDGTDVLKNIEQINFGGKLYNTTSLDAYQDALSNASREESQSSQPTSPLPSIPEPTPAKPEPIPVQDIPEWLSRHYLDHSSIIKSQAKGKKKGGKAFSSGDSGDNVLIASKGRKDTMTGNSGADLFAITSRKKKERDFITDFNNSEGDKIGVSRNALKGLSSINFAIASNKKELKVLFKEDANFIYLSGSGKLYYDQNGSGKGFGKGGGLFATLSGNPEITEEDIIMI